MINKDCKRTTCKHHASQSQGTRRYGDKCMNSGECPVAQIAISPNVIAVLDQPVRTADQYLRNLTDEELDYCINNETRKSGLKNLLAYKRYRQQSRIARCK